MAYIYIYKFNNYYNRVVKKTESLSDYPSYKYLESGTNLNFNPNDNVNTTFIAGRYNNAYNADGDYLVYSEDGITIKSRWFIIEQIRRLKGQYKLTLRRDLAVDFYDNLLNATCFIEKATISDNSPFIYNQEPISVNQIKTDVQPLKDETGSAWLVGYIARNTPQKSINLATATIIPDYTIDNLENWNYYKYTSSSAYTINKTNFIFIVGANKQRRSASSYYTAGNVYKNFNYYKRNNTLYLESAVLDPNNLSLDSNLIENINNAINNYKNLYYTKELNFSDVISLQNLNNKIIQVGNDFYKIETTLKNITDTIVLNNDLSGEYLYTFIKKQFNNQEGQYQLEFEYTSASISLTKLAYGEYSLTIPDETNRYHLKDAPYDMFIIPYSDSLSINGINSNKSLALNIGSEIARILGSQLYDLQLLPFCPITGYTINNNAMVIASDSKRLTEIKNASGEIVNYLIWCTVSSGRIKISARWALEDILNKKISNQCDMYRLVSPNFNGQFEFNRSKLENDNEIFYADYTYLPYNPYLRIYPHFSGLYGENFNDARGLICQGDFSIAYLSDNWVNYQINNKNYQNIFNRQIENMEKNHKFDKINNIVGSLTSALSAGVGVGSLTNPGLGVAAGVASISGGVADFAINEIKYKEAKAYATDTHNLQLDNIQAQPYSIAKTTAFTVNNQIFPLIEFYTCTEQEKQAVANEIINAGMTLNTIGTLFEYIFNSWSYLGVEDRGFLKGKIIKIDIDGDSHELVALDEELQKGLYFKDNK